jgi:hypothetical protein
LLGLRVGIPPGAWMFLLFVLYSKDKEIQIKNREEKKSRRGNGLLCCVLLIKTVKMEGNQDKETSRDRVQENRERKKFMVWARFLASLHTGPGAYPAVYVMCTGSLFRA